MKSGTTREHAARGYGPRVRIIAPAARVFGAITTLKGLRGWWTTKVSGSAAQGGDVRFEFEGLDEHIVMHVDAVERPHSVRWTCVAHSEFDEWNGTHLLFRIDEHGADECDLAFQHVGLRPELACYDDCEAGWEHFLSSLAAYVERGKAHLSAPTAEENESDERDADRCTPSLLERATCKLSLGCCERHG